MEATEQLVTVVDATEHQTIVMIIHTTVQAIIQAHTTAIGDHCGILVEIGCHQLVITQQRQSL